MFDISSLQYNSAYPGFASILATVISSMILGVLIAFTYDKTSRNVNRPNHFLQAMILITIVAATVIQAIGDSVARGLGMIGALSIIRFRTTVKNPRNIVFMFASIVIGIATGVFGFLIAIVGTLGFCATAFLLRFSSFSPRENFIGILRLNVNLRTSGRQPIEEIISLYCNKFQLMKNQFDVKKDFDSVVFSYELKLKKEEMGPSMLTDLNKLEGVDINKFFLDKRDSANI